MIKKAISALLASGSKISFILEVNSECNQKMSIWGLLLPQWYFQHKCLCPAAKLLKKTH